MFVFAPSYGSPSLYQSEVYHHQSINPRDKYLAAIVEVRSAEAAYVAALAREQALRKQREVDELRWLAALQRRQRLVDEEAVRKQSLLDALYANDAPSSNPFYTSRIHTHQPVQLLPARPDLTSRLFDLQRAEHQRREELAKQRCIARLRQKQAEERERERGQAFIHHLLQAKHKEPHAEVHRASDIMLHRLLLNILEDNATAHKAAPQVKVEPQTSRLRESSCRQTPSCQASCQLSVAPQAKQPEAKSSSKPAHPFSLKSRLESHLYTECDPDIANDAQKLHASLFVASPKLERKDRVQKKNQDSVNASATAGVPPVTGAPNVDADKNTSTPGLSMKDHIKATLQNPELHDFINALRASCIAAGYIPAATAKDITKTSSASAPAATDSKGKGKQVSFDLPTSAGTTEPTSKDVIDSMDTIHNIEAAFKALSTDFSFPVRLDFTPPSTPTTVLDFDLPSPSSSAITSELAYTSTNAPVRYYEQALSALLNQLDAVESWGNEEVRKGRKELVERVENALEEVEREVQVRLVQYRARQSATTVPTVASNNEQDIAEKKDRNIVTVRVESDEEKSGSVPVGVFAAVDAQENVRDEHQQQYAVDSEEEQAVILALVPAEENVPVVDTGSQETTSPAAEASETVEIDTYPTVVDQSSVTASSNDAQVQESGSSADSIQDVTSLEEEELAHSSYPPVPASVLSEVTKPTSLTIQSEEVQQEQEQDVTAASEPAPELSLAPSSPQPQTATEVESPGPVDTFLLPFEPLESPVISKRSDDDSDEVVVVDKEHGEASDGENWSVVEA